jgi:Tfp pilus assembly protein PilX
MHHPNSSVTARARGQRGVSLLFALLALVALSLATLALVRSVDTSALLLGNIGFKQDATASADQAARQAINWLTLNSATLNTDLSANGYYASTQELAADGVTVKPPVDATGQQLASTTNRQLIDWDGNNCQSAINGTYNGCTIQTKSAGTINGNTARYVIFRLCSKPGDFTQDTTISCAQHSTTSDSCGAKGAQDYSNQSLDCSATTAYYRIIVRTQGARNTASFTETIVHY